MPGLSYVEMVTYAARLRMIVSSTSPPRKQLFVLHYSLLSHSSSPLSETICQYNYFLQPTLPLTIVVFVFVNTATERDIAQRVNEVMEIMNLQSCKDRIITERPTSRGR